MARIAVTVATDNNWPEALLGYLTIGALGHAAMVNKKVFVKALLFGKAADPAAAAVGATPAARKAISGEFAKLAAEDLANWMQWMHDGAVIHAWQLIREQQEPRKRSQEDARHRPGPPPPGPVAESGTPV